MDINLPVEFTERMREDLGNEADSFLRSYFDEPKRGLRINTLKVSPGFLEKITCGLKKVPWEDHGFYYSSSGDEPGRAADSGDGSFSPGKNPLHAAGAYYIQEPSAMAPVSYLDVHPGMCVLDLCAAPGGKSTQIAACLDGSGLLVSNEIVPERASILSRNIERMGISNALVLSHDPAGLAERFPASFDRILVDAPCSGEGMMRRDETAVEEWSEENMKMCALRQAEILEAAATMLKPGGRLVYSTCTFSKEENEEQITNFLDKHKDYQAVKAEPAEGMRNSLFSTDAERGMMRIWPQDGYGEGHFIAVLERTGKTGAYGYSGAYEHSFNNKQKQEITPYNEFVTNVIKEGPFRDRISDPERLFVFKGRLCAMPVGRIPLLSGLKIIRAGLELGEIRKGRFIPSHSLALAMKKEDALRLAELAGEQESEDDVFKVSLSDAAKKYLNGQALAEDCVSCIKKDPAAENDGWTLVTVSGISAGWAKASKGILKNHYPKGIRINNQ